MRRHCPQYSYHKRDKRRLSVYRADYSQQAGIGATHCGGQQRYPPIRNQLDLAQKTLYIPKGSPALLRLKNLSHEIGDTIYVEEDALYSGEQLSIMVAKGDIDYAVCDRQTARIAKENLPEIDIDTDISFTQLQSWTLRKDSPVLLDSLNSWLKRIKDSGLYDQIYKRYYGKK